MRQRRRPTKFKYHPRDPADIHRRYGWPDPAKCSEAGDRLRALATALAARDREVERAYGQLVAEVERHPDIAIEWAKFAAAREDDLGCPPTAREVVAWARATAVRAGWAIVRSGPLRLVVDNDPARAADVPAHDRGRVGL